MVFFKEWKDSRRMVYLHSILSFAMLFLFFGIFVNIPSENQRALIYSLMLIWAAIPAAIDAMNEKSWIFAWAGWGDQKRAIPAFITGIALMFLVFSTKTFSISAPVVALSTVASFQFVYAVLGAPYIEEKFFRGSSQFSAIQMFEGNKIPYADVVAVITTNFFFAMFHGLAYSWEPTGLVAAFLFGMLASIGNQFFKSGAFSFGAHLMNNLLIFMR